MFYFIIDISEELAIPCCALQPATLAAVAVCRDSCSILSCFLLFLSRRWHIFNLYTMLQVNLFAARGSHVRYAIRVCVCGCIWYATSSAFDWILSSMHILCKQAARQDCCRLNSIALRCLWHGRNRGAWGEVEAVRGQAGRGGWRLNVAQHKQLETWSLFLLLRLLLLEAFFLLHVQPKQSKTFPPFNVVGALLLLPCCCYCYYCCCCLCAALFIGCFLSSFFCLSVFLCLFLFLFGCSAAVPAAAASVALAPFPVRTGINCVCLLMQPVRIRYIADLIVN